MAMKIAAVKHANAKYKVRVARFQVRYVILSSAVNGAKCERLAEAMAEASGRQRIGARVDVACGAIAIPEDTGSSEGICMASLLSVPKGRSVAALVEMHNVEKFRG